MASFLRDHFGITQERLASWLGVNRVALAQAEGGTRGLPLGKGLAEGRLTLAALGQLMHPDGTAEPAPLPPLLPPAPTRDPLAWRARMCRVTADKLALDLKMMQARALRLTHRLAALPILRAYTGPVKNPAREAGWLALLEGEAVDGLRDDCGAGPQCLLAARLAGLRAEAEVLETLLATLPPAEA